MACRAHIRLNEDAATTGAKEAQMPDALSAATRLSFCRSLESLGEPWAHVGTPNIFVTGNLVPNGRDLIPKHTERDGAHHSV